MENMFYAEELVREFLVFRGFTNTLQAFQTELSTDIGKGFDVDKILDLVFLVYVPKFQAEKLVSLLRFFKQYVSTTTETILVSTLSKLEASILRYYIVQAIQLGRKDKVVEFLGASGNDLLQKGQNWGPWFAIPYLKNPSLDPQFRIYFSKEWFDALRLSFRNFLSEIFSGARIPSLLKISTEKNTVKRLKMDIKQLNLKLSQLQALLEEKEAQICHYRSKTPALEGMLLQKSSSIDRPTTTMGKGADAENNLRSKGIDGGGISRSSSNLGEGEQQTQDQDSSGSSKLSTGLALSQLVPDSSSLAKISSGGSGSRGTYQMFEEYYYSVENGEVQREEEFPEVKVEFQETFLGHTSPISKCRFSASGTNIASASTDGTVRIWTYDSSVPTSRNAAIYCGAEIMSLDWECKSDRLLLIGTANGGIKAWNVDAKRVVCDLNTTQAFPSVLDLKCSPVEPIFVSAAASRGNGSSNLDNMKFASLTVWNMKTWKPMTVLPLGEDPPAITSLSFNHNGKILAAAATDGMIHMFDMSAGLQITGWPAHDSAISSVLFGRDETSIFSLGSDGKIFEWSLQNQGEILWSRDCSRFCNLGSSRNYRHEMAFDSSGKKLLVSSGSVRSSIYQVVWDDIQIEPIEPPLEPYEGNTIVAREMPDVDKDWTSYFTTNMVFDSKESLRLWLLKKGRVHNMAIVVGKSDYSSGRASRIFYQCERNGVYKKPKPPQPLHEEIVKKTGTKSGKVKKTDTKKCGCLFKIKATSSDGNNWTIEVVEGHHNHPLSPYNHGHACHNRLSSEEKELFINLSSAGMRPKAALGVLQERNPEISSSLQTLYNVKKKEKKEVMEDRSVLQQMMLLADERSYIILDRRDESDVVMNLFFAHPESIALAKCFPYVFLMDATYKTNLHKWPLFEIVGVTSTIKTFSVAYCFMEYETEENFVWLLERFRYLLNEDELPQALVTDRELALMNALEVVFPESKHLLCRWHIKMGVEKKGKKVLPKDGDDPENALKIKWREMWDTVTHSPTEEKYEANLNALQQEWVEWPDLYDYVVEEWIPYKEKFVAAWTDKVFHVGNTQTSRVESAHSSLKDWLRKSSKNTFLSTLR